MIDEYAYLRSQYEQIIEHTSYLLRNAVDPRILSKAYESKLRAQQELARLNRATLPSLVRQNA